MATPGGRALMVVTATAIALFALNGAPVLPFAATTPLVSGPMTWTAATGLGSASSGGQYPLDERHGKGASATMDDLSVEATNTSTTNVTAAPPVSTFSVLSFGAVGDDIADDTSEIQAAITAAAAAGGTVSVPAGKYRVSAALNVPANTTITGIGVIHQGTAATTGFRVTGSDVTIEGITIVGRQSTPAYAGGEYAIFAQGASATEPLRRINIRDVTVSKWGYAGVYAQYVEALEVTDCNIFDIGYGGVMLDSTSHGNVSHNRVDNITPGVSNNMYGIAIAFGGTGGATDPASHDIVVDGNTVSRVAWEGIDSHGGSRLTISNNTVLACGTGITVFATGSFIPKDIVISGNTIDSEKDTAPPSGGSAILLWGDTDGTTVSGYATGSVTGNVIRRSQQVSFRATQDLVVSGNTFDQSNGYGIYLSHNNDRFSITRNRFIDMWSDLSNTSAIQSSQPTNSGLIEGNLLRAGSKSATYLNRYGLYHNGLAGITLRANDFTAATVASVAGTL